MKNKLYKVDYFYRINGKDFTLFRHKPINIKIDRVGTNFLMTNEEEIEETIKTLIDKRAEELKKEIEEDKCLTLIDYNGSLFGCEKTIKEIVSVEPLKYGYREATMDEYMKNAPYSLFLEDIRKIAATPTGKDILTDIINNHIVKKDK